MRHPIRGFLGSLFTLLLSVALVTAQSECSAIVETALESVGENCDDTGRNIACYGFNQVEASFAVDVAEDFFTVPADTSSVGDLQTIRTAPLDVENDIWGVAVMNIQANLPNTIPGQSVTTILLGDVEVDNAVAPDAVFNPSDGIPATVAVAAGANIRSGPATNFNVVGGARPDTELLADGLSQDGAWLRVAFNERPAWVSLSVVTVNEDDLASVPTLTPELRTPMQAFYLRTGIGRVDCEDVPGDVLLVQGPQNIEITLTVNGADVNVGSSGLLRLVEVDGEIFLENIVFDGVFDWNGVRVRRGQRTRLCLSNPQDLNSDGIENEREVTCDPTPPEAVPGDQFESLWCGLENLPRGLFNYRLDVPCSDDIVTNGGGGGAASQSQVREVDCSRFSIPAQTIIATDFIFDWSDVPGATSYIVAIFDENNVELQTIPTTQSVLPTNGGDWPPTGYVDVRAYRDGVYACFARYNFFRLVNPNPENPVQTGGGSGFSGSLSNCMFDPFGIVVTATVSWSNAPDPASINVSWQAGEGNLSSGGSGASGSVPINGQSFINSVNISSGGESRSLGSC